MITATVERTTFEWLSGYSTGGWKGRTSTGRAAYIRDGQAWWFAEDFAANGKLTDEEQAALDRAAMQALAKAGGKGQ